MGAVPPVVAADSLLWGADRPTRSAGYESVAPDPHERVDVWDSGVWGSDKTALHTRGLAVGYGCAINVWRIHCRER